MFSFQVYKVRGALFLFPVLSHNPEITLSKRESEGDPLLLAFVRYVKIHLPSEHLAFRLSAYSGDHITLETLRQHAWAGGDQAWQMLVDTRELLKSLPDGPLDVIVHRLDYAQLENFSHVTREMLRASICNIALKLGLNRECAVSLGLELDNNEEDISPPLKGFCAWPLLLEMVAAARAKRAVVFEGISGIGKTHFAKPFAKLLVALESFEIRKLFQDNRKDIARLSFSETLSYQEFFIGYRPHPPHGYYSLQPGSFLHFLGYRMRQPRTPVQLAADRFSKRAKRAVLQRTNKSDHPRALIMDEANRGNTPAVFGELITMMEDRDKPVDLAVLPGQQVELPSTTYLLGTMNSNDRALTPWSRALWERFVVIQFPPVFLVPSLPQRLAHLPGDVLRALGDQFLLQESHAVTIGYNVFLENPEYISLLALSPGNRASACPGVAALTQTFQGALVSQGYTLAQMMPLLQAFTGVNLFIKSVWASIPAASAAQDPPFMGFGRLVAPRFIIQEYEDGQSRSAAQIEHARLIWTHSLYPALLRILRPYARDAALLSFLHISHWLM